MSGTTHTVSIVSHKWEIDRPWLLNRLLLPRDSKLSHAKSKGEKKRLGNAPSASLTHQQLPGADSRIDTEFSSGFLGFSSDLSCAQNRKTIT